MLRIKEIAKEKGISIKDIANNLGITSPALSQNISGRVGLDRLQKIADILNVPITELFEPPAADEINCPVCGAKLTLKKQE